MKTSHLMPSYNRTALKFTHGEGAWLYRADGTKYLDFASGIGVNSLGHAHPRLVNALKAQSEKLWHVSNLYTIPEQEKLAEVLCEKTFADYVFFCNSGAEAVEGVIKTARKYFAAQGKNEKTNIITFTNAFHGRTLGALAAAGKAAHLDGFGEPLSGFIHIDGFDIEKVKSKIDHTIAAILLEPIQGEGGIYAVPPEFLRELRALCDAHDILLALDEVQSGMGRSGKLFTYEWARIEPDLMAVAKGLGGGFPIGAILASANTAQAMIAGTHGSTFGGNPLAMAIGIQIMDIIGNEDFLQKVNERAGKLRQGLSRLLDEYPDILSELHGTGLMLGLKTKIVNTDFIHALRAQNLLTVGAGNNHVRLLPPLNISRDDINNALEKIEAACNTIRVEREREKENV